MFFLHHKEKGLPLPDSIMISGYLWHWGCFTSLEKGFVLLSTIDYLVDLQWKEMISNAERWQKNIHHAANIKKLNERKINKTNKWLGSNVLFYCYLYDNNCSLPPLMKLLFNYCELIFLMKCYFIPTSFFILFFTSMPHGNPQLPSVKM